MKKKITVIILGIGVIIGLFFAVKYLNEYSKNTTISNKDAEGISLVSFAIEDTASVDKIELFDSFTNQSITLTRKKDRTWVGDNDMCVQQPIVNMMLETMYKITLRGYVPKSAVENMKKLMMANHKEVKIYQNGKWVKTWFVGHSTQDHMGTHMLLHTPKAVSDNPVIMGMKGFYGILEPRFFADYRKFVCTDLFSFTRDELKSVEIINRVNPHESYKIKINSSDNYEISSLGQPLENFNKDNLVFYLNSFQNIHFNQPNYTLSEKEIDSIKAVTPDYELQIDGNDKSYHLDMYRRLDPEYNPKDTIAWDQNYLWAVREGGELVRMQYYTVNPLLQGKFIFMEE